MATMETTVSLETVVAGEPEAAFDEFVDELAESLARRGMTLEPGARGRVGERGVEVGRVVDWRRGEHILLEWRHADWASEEVTEVEIRFAAAEAETRVTVEHRGFGRLFWDERDLAGWFADQAVAPLLAASAPVAFGDWLTDRAARRPGGAPQRDSYRDPSHHRPSFGAILAVLDPRPEDVLLEIGCGGGAFLELALRSGCRAAGIDHSPEMVRVARELNADAVAAGRLDVVQASAELLPFEDDSFTCAAMMQIFFFFADPAAVLAECRRVLRPEGRLAVFTISEKARGTPAAPEPMASRSYFHTDAELVGLARSAGFAEAAVEHPDLEPHARAAGLPEDVVALFIGDPAGSQLLIAK